MFDRLVAEMNDAIRLDRIATFEVAGSGAGMAVNDQKIADTVRALQRRLLRGAADAARCGVVHLSVYSPPFCGLYNYSSHDQDMSNNRPTTVSSSITRSWSRARPGDQAGRMSAVHCMDIPNPGQRTGYYDFPGKVIALHERGRLPLLRPRVHLEGAAEGRDPHAAAAPDAQAAGQGQHTEHGRGRRPVPVLQAARRECRAGDPRPGSTATPAARGAARALAVQGRDRPEGRTGSRHWIWRQYASCFWDDIRLDRVLPYKAAKEPDDEKHVHPLQLDAIERVVARCGATPATSC
jgi:hypothetical protein